MTLLPGRLVLLGRPVAHSLSPVFQNAALRRAALPLEYEAIDVSPGELPGMLLSLRQARGAGNVTIPHKAAVAAACDSLTLVAQRTRAVNTFWMEGGALVGDNTDVVGFLKLVESLQLPYIPRRVALLGAGGAAAAVCEAVREWEGASLRVFSRTSVRSVALAERFAGATSVDSHDALLEDADLVVNATPVGLMGDDVPVSVDLLPRDAAVTDLVYRAGSTRWVREAQARGHPAADGLVMLVEQGAAAFRRWFGIDPDRDVMWSAIRGG